jgi:hypothetical protein
MTGGWHQASTCRTGDGRDLTPDALTRLCCDAHHILPWNRGGRTDLDNLIPLRTQHHHHLVHEGQWQIQLTPNRSVRITRPDRQAHHPPAGVR